jgi:phospholipid/cholesterol/gamma-HCH transport system substrate-binding protein
MNRNIRIGIFTAIGVALIVGFSVYVNDHPYWYRACNEVKIHVDDATGLRRKSPVKTLGLEIGYINAVHLDGDRVLIKVCVTGPVKLNTDTRAYIRSAGFLGDKFLELKPVDLVDAPTAEKAKKPKNIIPTEKTAPEKNPENTPASDDVKNSSSAPLLINEGEMGNDNLPALQDEEEKPFNLQIESKLKRFHNPSFVRLFFPARAHAINEIKAEQPTLSASREAELSDTVKKVGKLIDQLSLMVGDLREVTQQKEFKETVINLNSAMKHLEGLLRPNGKTIKNLDTALESLKNAMAQGEEVMQKVNKGDGTIGKFINDPSIFNELKGAIQSINLLLGKAGALKTYVDIAGWSVPAYDGSKAKFSVMIAPNPERYYLLGISSDPRGRDRKTTTTTSVNGSTPAVEIKSVNEEKGLRITALLGKYFGRLDLAVGLIEDGGGIVAGYWFDEERRFGIKSEVFSTGKGEPLTLRVSAKAHVYSGLYVTGGLDSVREYRGKSTYFVGAGLFFNDDDLKYLLAFR